MFKWLFKRNEENIDYNFCINLKEKYYPKYLMKIFENKMGYKFKLKSPQTLNEIVQYLKLYDNLPIKAKLTDKTLVNEFVESNLCTSKYTKEVYGIYDSILDVNFDDLPDKFIIKKNNGCFNNYPILNKTIFLQKFKHQTISSILENERINYAFVNGFELQYKDISTKIIIERLYPKIKEYQVLCTYGNPLFVYLLDEKNHIYNYLYYLDKNGNVLNAFEEKKLIQEIIEMARVLSKEFKLVRVDFMVVNNKYLFFQELTFTPYSGYAKELDEYNSNFWGSKVNLNIK